MIEEDLDEESDSLKSDEDDNDAEDEEAIE
jgi:hypothetical protein